MLTGEVPFKGENQVAVAMKHVREPLPDVQRTRPEMSAALAAVIDRATAKRPEDRYADDAELIADLEDVLAIESARSGSITGEVTSVLRSLPSQAQRRVPFRMRHRVVAVLLLLMAAAAVIAAVVFVGSRAHHGVGPPSVKPPPSKRALTAVIPCGSCAQGFNPLGLPTDETPNADLAIDNQAGTYWATQQYYDHKLGKAGTGIYVNYGPGTRQGTTGAYLKIIAATPGFTATIYARHNAPPIRWPDPGWVKVSPSTVVGTNTTIKLTSSDTPYRYFLVWITSLGGREQLLIDQIELYRYKNG
jgi:serine/threonine-protein kinase